MTITVSTELEPVTCCECGMLYAMPERVKRERMRDHKTFYCPAGHQQHFPGKSDIELLRDQVASEKSKRDQAEAAAAQAQAEKRAAERQRQKIADSLRRTKQRVHGGKCTLCKKNFTALRRHMADKHPECKP